MSPFWNWFWHIVAGISVMLLGLPTFTLQKLERRFATHQKLRPEQIASVTYADQTLHPAQIEHFVSAFNAANFLIKRVKPLNYSTTPVTLALTGKLGEYRLYPYGQDVDVVRHRNGKAMAYQIRSAELCRWFLERQQQASE